MSAPSSKRIDSPHAITWPAERFFWAEVDAASLGARPTSRRLGFLMEAVIPIPIERLHVVFAPIGRRRFVGCGIEREVLARDLPPDAIALRPASTPAFVSGCVDCRALNLLHGEFEPARLSRLRRLTLMVVMALLVTGAGLLAIGLHRREQSHRDGAAAAEALRRELLAAAIGPAAGQPNADLLLASELSQLRATRDAPLPVVGDRYASEDAAGVLAELLRAWPVEVHLLAESISVGPGTATVVGSVPEPADAQRAADAFAGFVAAQRARFPGTRWRLDQPRFEAGRDGMKVTMRLRRESSQ